MSEGKIKAVEAMAEDVRRILGWVGEAPDTEVRHRLEYAAHQLQRGADRLARLAGLVRERLGLVDDFNPADDYRAWRRKTDRFIAIDRELRALIGEIYGEGESDG